MLESPKNSKSPGKFYLKTGGRIILIGTTQSAQSHRHITFLKELCIVITWALPTPRPQPDPTQKVRFEIESRLTGRRREE